jgi:Holliday junction resolvase RusA-like endonuclease
MITLKYTGDLCPLNQKYVNRRYALSSRYRDDKVLIAWNIKMQLGANFKPLIGNLVMELNTYYNRDHDIDAFIKIILDSMNNLVYEDDKQIIKLTVTKNKSKEVGFEAIIKQLDN